MDNVGPREDQSLAGGVNQHDGNSVGEGAQNRASDRPNAPDILSNREYALLQYYTDPSSPGFGNAARCARLAGYKGSPGSPQLAVQGSRTLRRAREHGLLRALLNQSGCTLEHAAQRLNACLEAKRRRVFFYEGDVIEGPLEDDYHHQLEAIKVVIGLHGSLDRHGDAQVESSSAHATDQESFSGEYKHAFEMVGDSSPVDRDALRDVLECDEKLRHFEAEDHQSAGAHEAEDGAT